MTTKTATLAQAQSKILPVLASLMIGLSIVFVVGHVQASSLHDAAHDMRHSTGFPCH